MGKNLLAQVKRPSAEGNASNALKEKGWINSPPP